MQRVRNILLGFTAALLLQFTPESGFISSAQANLDLPNVARTCLPTNDRMSRDRTQACHCPPEEMCPQTMEEWYMAEVLPPFIAAACCDAPYVCDVQYHKTMPTACPGRKELGPRIFGFCALYDAIDVDGAQDPDDPDFDPALPENVEQAVREQAAEAYNTCYVDTGCQGMIDRLLASGTNQPQSQNMNNAEFDEFVQCQMACDQEAMDILGITDITRAQQTVLDLVGAGSVNWLTMNDNDNAAFFRHNNASDVFEASTGWDDFRFYATYFRGRVINPSRLFPSYQSPNNQYMYFHFAMNVNEPQVGTPPVNGNPKGSNLEDKLSCGSYDTPAICMTIQANNTTCGSCLAPETPVLMADGSSKAINTVAAGDVVKSYNGTAIIEEVIIIDWPTLTLYSINGGELMLTADHPIMTKHGWRAVNYYEDIDRSVKKYGLQQVPNLKVGDIMMTESGELEVKSIEAMETKSNAQTYNLKLKGAEGFYANGILVKDN